MKLPIKWLNNFLDTKANSREIADKLTNLGIEVENIIDPEIYLKGFVVAEIVSCEKHPDADKLKVCMVDYGGQIPVQVVCGANNARKGLKSIFATSGAVIPQSNQVLKKGSIRGVESNGMLCSYSELLLQGDSAGIIELNNTFENGTSASIALNLSAVLDLSITPNRGDCFSILGISRELKSLGVFKDLTKDVKSVSGSFTADIKIINQASGCKSFLAKIIKNVQNKTSPEWLQELLKLSGLNPISFLVDLTNYSCIGFNRPMHVFDYEKIKGDLLIRYSKKGEEFLGLNGQSYTLDDGMIVICDDSGIISLAGIMGGINTSCDLDTKNILLESALFDKIEISLAGQKLNLSSDSRTRFERGVDESIVEPMLELITQQIIENCGGMTSETLGFRYQLTEKYIDFNLDLVKKIGGIDLSKNQIEHYLNSIDIGLNESKLKIPFWRHDLNIQEDIVEEILRLHGYDNIPMVDLDLNIQSLQNVKENIINKMTNFLVNKGFNEAISWSFIDEKTANNFLNKDLIEIANPISQDFKFMRPSILSSLTKILEKNHAEERKNCLLFEIGKQFNDKLSEQNVLACVKTGYVNEQHWQFKQKSIDFFDIKSDLFALLEIASINNFQIEASGPKYYHSGRVLTVKQGKNIIATCGQLHPYVFASDCFALEIFLDNLNYKVKKNTPFLSPYPVAKRDFAFIVNRQAKVGEIVDAVYKIDKNLIRDIKVFDVYEDEKLGDNLKSIAFNLHLQSEGHTLQEKEINQISEKIIDILAKQWQGVLRRDFQA